MMKFADKWLKEGEKKEKHPEKNIPDPESKPGMYSVINGIRIGTGVEGHRTWSDNWKLSSSWGGAFQGQDGNLVQ